MRLVTHPGVKRLVMRGKGSHEFVIYLRARRVVIMMLMRHDERLVV